MNAVGIIANPAAGKDIRRLVAQASTFDNNEKVNIVRRILLGLEAAGVQQVWFMPDYYGICNRAVENLGRTLDLKLNYLDFHLDYSASDSTKAASMLDEMGVSCILTLGGDGTNRVVAKGCGQTPLLPISTGTNNVFPYMMEGTLAGLAAGLLATQVVSSEEVTDPTRRLEIEDGQRMVDIALVDVAIYDERFIGARAVWEIEKVLQVFLSRAEPYQIGFSSIGGNLDPSTLKDECGMVIEIGSGPTRVLAPIAPGLIKWIPIHSYTPFKVGEVFPLKPVPSVIALDGEREFVADSALNWSIRLSQNGPRLVDPKRVLRLAAERGFFLES